MSQACGGKRDPKNPFMLTPTEERVLVMLRAGMTQRQMCNELGRPYPGSQVEVGRVVEKDRLRKLHDDRRGQGSSLATARGAIRMKGTR